MPKKLPKLVESCYLRILTSAIPWSLCGAT